MALKTSVTCGNICFWLLTCVCLLCSLLCGPTSVQAEQLQDIKNSSDDASVEYPGIDKLVPLSTTLAIEATDAKNLLGKLSDIDSFVSQINDNQQILLTLDQNLGGWGPINQWSEGRLLGARQRLAAVRNRQATQLDNLSKPFKAVEELRQVWSDKKTFWSGWQRALKSANIKAPADIFIKAKITVEEVIDRTTTVMAALTEQQQKLSAQQELITTWLAQVNETLEKLHGPLLERNAPLLFSTEFLSQFNANLLVGLRDDLSSITQVPDDFALRHGWIAIMQLVVALTIAWKFFRRARAPEPVPERWQFLLGHPAAGALFITLIAGAFFYTEPPPLWRWVQIVLGTVAATVLISAMLDRPRLNRVIVTLAVLFVCSSTIQLIGLVQPFHRLFLIVVCVTAAPLCLAAARRQRKRNDGRLDMLGMAFYLGTVAACIGLVAEIVGYHDLTAYLVNSLLGTTFVFLFARMALHLGKGGISTLLEVEAVNKRRFVRRLGPDIGPRLNVLLHVIVIAYALLYLLARWRVYATPKEAWTGIRALSFKIGELQVSMDILLMVACVLYVTLILSWVIQALLDSEVMTPQGMEYGVKVAVKTLLHYSLVLIGFLVAISVAGIDMSKFAILAGALGVGIGFGLQNIVNNFLSGLILLFERPIKVGDTISLDDQWGTITRIGLRSTVVETLDRSEVIVPNSELISQRVVNWTFTSNVVRVVLPIGVAYGTSLEKVLEILIKVARNHAEVLIDPAPSAIFLRFGDSSIDFELRAWIANVNQRLRIRSELGLAVDKEFRDNGIVIPFPQRDLHLQSIAPNLHEMLPKQNLTTTTPAKETRT